MDKIAFIGTHGVGKTVLTFAVASTLRRQGFDADVSYENSRRSPFPINEATTLEGQSWILATQWKEELEAGLRSEIVVCDRSAIDNYAYLVHACGYQEYLHPWLRHWLTTYTLLFLVPAPDEDPRADRARATDRLFRDRIQSQILDLLQLFPLDDRLVRLEGDRSRHLETVLTTLHERKILDRLPPGQPGLF